MSIGWCGGGVSPAAAATHTCAHAPSSPSRNPFYKNERKTAEVHILHAFTADFYGAHLRAAVTGFLRNELNFTGVEALIAAIATDIRLARERLEAGGDYAMGAPAAAFFAAPLPPPRTAA